MTNRRRLFTGLAMLSVFAAVGVIGLHAADAPNADDRAAITKTAEAFVAAYAKGDSAALANFWSPEGDYVDLNGRVLTGRKAIAADFAELFSQSKGLSLRIEVHSVRFPTADTAVEDGVTSVLSADGSLPNRAHYTNTLVKRDGKWLLETVRESPYAPPSNYEHLRPLEWVVGEWIEDTKTDPVGRVMFQWTPDQNFIVGSRAVGVKDVLMDNGSQRIGWDPAGKMLRTWSFEADGGFGEGTWKKDGDKWVVTMSSVLRSGSLMTATTTISRVDADTITWQVKNQVVDGKTLPDSPVVKMKRAE